MRRLLLVAVLLLFCTSLLAQRAFTVQVDSLTRAYFVSVPGGETVSLPLFIILHDNGIRPTSLESLPWHKLKQPAVIVFPAGLLTQWHCKNNEDSLLAIRDQKFLLKLLFQVQNNFRTDLSRTFIIGMGDAHCLAQDLLRTNPALIRSAIQWDYQKDLVESKIIVPEPARKLDSLVSHNPSTPREPEKMKVPFEQEEAVFKPYRKHVSFAITLGRWQQAESSRTEFDTTTFVDIAKSHFMIGIQAEYNVTERLSVFADMNIVTIPKKQNINAVTFGPGGVQATGDGHGGIIVPFGAGIRYAFPYGNFRPFITGAVGRTHIHAEGGTGSGNSSTGIAKNITKKVENVLTYRIGAGFDYRLSGTVSFRLVSSYFMSSKIDPPAGSVDAFRGLSIVAGLAFVLGK
jgi:opacity protein-like surface antigen